MPFPIIFTEEIRSGIIVFTLFDALVFLVKEKPPSGCLLYRWRF